MYNLRVHGMEYLSQRTLRKVHTKDNTKPNEWWALANKAFAKRGLPEPLLGEVHDAYMMGESPETWADYVLNT